MKINSFTPYTSPITQIKKTSFSKSSIIYQEDTFVKTNNDENSQLLSSIPQIRESVQAYCKNNPKTEEDDAIQSILLAILEEQVNSQKNGKDVNNDEFAQVVTSATETS